MSQELPAAISSPRWSVDLRGVPIVEADMAEGVRGEVQRSEPTTEIKPTGWLTFGSIKAAWRDGDRFMGAADGRRSARAAGI